MQYVDFELSYDTLHANAENLYRLTNDRYQNGALTQHGVITYPSVPKAMAADYPEVVNYSRLIQFSRVYLRYDEIGFDESIVYADSAFLSMFSFPLLRGDAKTALAAPNSILLSESSARKYFGTNWDQGNILGEVVNVDNRSDFVVTGVFKNVAANSHMKFDFLASYKTLKQIWSEAEDSWTNSNFMVYLQLAPGTDPKALEQKFIDFSERYFQGTKVTNSLERFFLQPLKEIHLYSDYEYETWVQGNGTVVWALLLIAGFILIIAWVNYINLTTARAAERGKEVGVRKVVGAQRGQLIKQFLIESLLYSAVGIVVAIVFVELLQPSVSDHLGIHLSSSFLTGNFVLAFILLFLVGTIASGLYPGVIISSFNMNSVLRGNLARSARGHLLRKGLVVFQFVMSFVLIAGTYTVYSQIDYMLHQNLGMKIDQTLVVQGPRLTNWDSTYYNNINSFKAELLRYPAIKHVTASQRLPGNRTGRIFGVQRKGGDPEQRYTTSQIGIDYQFFETFKMLILTGRGFDRSDHNFDFNSIKSVVLNERAARLLGFSDPEQAIHRELHYWGKDWEIIGVVADHHQQSLHVPVEPIIFMPLYSPGNFFFIKIKPHSLAETITVVKNTYLELYPDNSFKHFFLDDYFNRQYQADQRFGVIFGLFAFFGVLIACLGVFGLSFFTIAQRTKEIGVRKVLGASVPGIFGLLSKDFAQPVLLANLIAWPIAWYVINKWLEKFAYRIEIDLGIFVIAGSLALSIALLTVSYQALKAALANPVESLRYE
jgi:putative ABC transport system permease protein